ncbi:UbiA family prenyltransferase [Chryseobacterium taklimakanense]|uniref:Prenyltransferase n=1 Tax=Chryseobacterium taklimakanense TaxID=536441 RepID=A0A239WSV4_9FLAO|nr:UbiA family prenyltransferase [Chryseobacterium taklimakanense]MCG7280909.1 UbiA family prenyltransferase [Chryseobacterium taklimakanense]SNV37571.1 prenyltransferase [Chryseobacterium taklimakanense]
MTEENPVLYRISQFVSLLLGARIFMLILFAFSLYVSTFFLFNQEENLRKFVFDFKVHGIIFCSLLSIAAGGIINQFYDLEKDRLQKPFRTRLQSFLKQKYFLYSYIALNAISLGIAYLLSPRIFVFFLIYQFLMWFYSHKLSKVLVLNNLTFVTLTLYPFFGMLVYYQHFSWKLFLMAAFLFLILLIIDVLKDFLTMRPDTIFGYQTLPIIAGLKTSTAIVSILLVLNALISCLIVYKIPEHNFLVIYFSFSAILLILSMYPVFFFKFKKMFWLLNLLRIWVFIGVIFMLLNGIFERI